MRFCARYVLLDRPRYPQVNPGGESLRMWKSEIISLTKTLLSNEKSFGLSFQSIDGEGRQVDVHFSYLSHPSQGGPLLAEAVLTGGPTFFYTRAKAELTVMSLGFMSIGRAYILECTVLKYWGKMTC